MKIGFAQINTTVGDLPGNQTLILDAYRSLVEAGAEIVLTPELALCGYPPRDLVLKPRFLADIAAAREKIAREIGSVPLLLGWAEANLTGTGRPVYNAAAWCETGEVRANARKCLLPTYDVFDEDRYFECGEEPLIVRFQGQAIGITICEDIWTAPVADVHYRYKGDPVAHLAARQPDVVLNLSASPWHLGKGSIRDEVVTYAARQIGAPLAYCNAIGGNDELIFDGASVLANASGQIVTRLVPFEEETAVCDTHATPTESPALEPMDELHKALVLGLRDYAHKSGFRQAVIGLSGGIDSAVTAALAADALGADNVLGIALPSKISSGHSVEDARELARNLGIAFEEISIAPIVEAVESALAPLFAGREPDVTEENIQARARGILLMAASNKFGRILLSTGNKSELAVGYCTLYGDMAGGLAVISDVPKTRVYALAEHLNREGVRIPHHTIVKPPSAELRPDQKDEDSLPAYHVLDSILEGLIERHASATDLTGPEVSLPLAREIARKVDLNEYKRKQAAPGLKTTSVAFGTGRRIPLVQKYVG